MGNTSSAEQVWRNLPGFLRRGGREPLSDIAATGVWPTGEVPENSTLAPKLIVENRGDVAMVVSAHIVIEGQDSEWEGDTAEQTVEPGATAELVATTDWDPSGPGEYTISGVLVAAGDELATNDAADGDITVIESPVVVDAECPGMSWPAGDVALATEEHPAIRVKNNGTDSALIAGVVRIYAIGNPSPLFEEELDPVSVAPGDEEVLAATMKWKAEPAGNYRAEGTAVLEGDEVPENDECELGFRVLPA
jgi:hypothetical protein